MLLKVGDIGIRLLIIQHRKPTMISTTSIVMIDMAEVFGYNPVL